MLLDLHCHFSFKPANSTNFSTGNIPDSDHWRERIRRREDYVDLISRLDRTVIKTSQIHGDSALAGGFRVLVNSLYPLERGFTGVLAIKPAAMLSGFSPRTIDDIRTGRSSYFEHLEREYRNLVNNQRIGSSTITGARYSVVNSFQELERLLTGNANVLGVINSIEGAHAFADNLYDKLGRSINIHQAERAFVRQTGTRTGDTWFEHYIEAMMRNIDKVKSDWSHTPFFVTFAHHYYNHLCGHSESLPGIVDFFFDQDGAVLDHDGQSLVNYYYLGIRPWGKKILAHLLKRKDQQGNPVRRVLIDTKHMSPQARLDYMQIVDQMLAYDPIPVIVSHTAVSGRKNLSRTIANDMELLSDEKEQESIQYFYNGVINLFDDEIEHIVKSDGIMGLMIDERRIMGKKLPPEAGLALSEFNDLVRKNKRSLRLLYSIKHKHAWGKMSLEEYDQERSSYEAAVRDRCELIRPAYLSIVFRQIFHILDLVGAKGWDHVALGTDYDGLINPLDLYTRASDMSTLKADLAAHWKAMNQHTNTDVRSTYQRYLYGMQPEHWIEKLLWGNGMEFLRKYYGDEYLLNGRLLA